MKLITLVLALVFTWHAHAAIELAKERYPLVKCTNARGLIVSVYNLEEQKTAQLVVQSTANGAVIVANETVRPIQGSDAQVFLSPNASLRVVPNGSDLKGFLNLHQNQPSVGTPLECETYFHILAPPASNDAVVE